MTWIKRNLFFVIGSLVALGLMVVGVLLLLSQIADEKSVSDQIQSQYTTLKTLNTEKPHPGAGTIDNIATAKDQVAQLHDYITKTRKVFVRIPPIPDLPTNKISNREFATQLQNTISELRRTAERQGVLLSDTNFTFSSQMRALNFDAASLGPLASHLGEVNALAQILFDARVNALDSIRREVVAPSDDTMSEYISQKTVTNALAELTPYELRFKCFSGELAQVLAGMASSPHGFVVKTINITHADSVFGMPDNMAGAAMPAGPPPGVVSMEAAAAARARLIAQGRVAPGRTSGGFGAGGMPQPNMPPPGGMQPAPAPRGPQVVLNEKPVQVTMLVQVVKLRNTDAKPAAGKTAPK